MQQLTTAKRPLWNKLLEELIIEEYTEEFDDNTLTSAERLGAPVIICPDRVFDSSSMRRERNTRVYNWGEIYFADLRLLSVAFFVYQNVIGDEQAVDLYTQTLDEDLPASDFFNVSFPIFLESDGDMIPLELDAMTVSEFLKTVDSESLYIIEKDSYSLWHESEYFEHSWELVSDLLWKMDDMRLHRLTLQPDGDSAQGILTEYTLVEDFVGLVNDNLYTEDDLDRSFYPNEQDALSVQGVFSYKGGGFSCNN